MLMASSESPSDPNAERTPDGRTAIVSGSTSEIGLAYRPGSGHCRGEGNAKRFRRCRRNRQARPGRQRHERKTPRSRRRMARGRWAGRLRLRHRRRPPHPPLPRAAADRDDAADRPGRPGQRHRGLGRDRRAALRAVDASTTRRMSAIRTGSAHRLPLRATPWPTWTFRLDDGSISRAGDLRRPRRLRDGAALAAAGRGRRRRGSWSGRCSRGATITRCIARTRASISAAVTQGGNVAWRPYPTCRRSRRSATASYRAEPDWYRNFTYDAEEARGLDHVEDLASPGAFAWDLGERRSACWCCGPATGCRSAPSRMPRGWPRPKRPAARRRPRRWPLAAESYLVDRGRGRHRPRRLSLVHRLGPRHLHRAARACARDRPARRCRARSCPAGPARVSEGMLPNRFPDQRRARRSSTRSTPRSGSSSRCHDFLAAASAAGRAGRAGHASRPARGRSRRSSTATRAARASASALDADGLLAAGEPGVQLTWMDAKVGDWVVTPRIGKPVEIQALWLNALRIAGAWTDRWTAARGAQAAPAFLARFRTRDRRPLSTSSMSITSRARSTPASGRIRSSRSAACPIALLDGSAARARRRPGRARSC